MAQSVETLIGSGCQWQTFSPAMVRIQPRSHAKARTMFKALSIPLVAMPLAAAALILSLQGAAAQSAPGGGQCAARDRVVSALAAKYGETRHGIGLAANNTVMEVFASEKTGTWTITVTMPTGVTCMVASGQGYEALAETMPVPGLPT